MTFVVPRHRRSDAGSPRRFTVNVSAKPPRRLAAAALLAVARVWIKRLNIQGGRTVTAQAEDARRMCRILGVDFMAIFAEARRAIPQPKSRPACSEPDPPTVSTDPIDNDSQVDEEPNAAGYDEDAVAAKVG